MNTLRSKGIPITGPLTRGEASDILNQVNSQIAATPKQRYFIKKYSLHTRPEILSKDEARRLIGAYHKKAS